MKIIHLNWDKVEEQQEIDIDVSIKEHNILEFNISEYCCILDSNKFSSFFLIDEEHFHNFVLTHSEIIDKVFSSIKELVDSELNSLK